MSALREILARFSTTFDDRELVKGEKAVSRTTRMMTGLTEQLRMLAPAVGAAALVGGFNRFASEVDALAKQARALNMPIEMLQAWRRAANRAGLETTVLETGLSKIQKKAFDSTQTGGALAGAFDRLGVSVKNTDGTFKGADELFQEVGAGIASIDDQTEKTALAMLLFEEQGAKFLNLFGQSPEAIKATLDEMGKLGAITEEQAADIEKMNDAFGDVKLALFGLAAVISGVVVPGLTWLAEKLESAQVFLRETAESSNILQAGLVVLSAIILSKVVTAMAAWVAANHALLLSWLKIVAPIALAILLVDELITTWQGGDTLIRRSIDGIFGEGTTAKIVDFFKGATANAAEFFDGTAHKWEQLGGDILYILDELLMGIGEWLANVGADFSYLIGDIKGWFSGLWDGVIQGARDMAGQVRGMLMNIPGASLILGSDGPGAGPSAPPPGNTSVQGGDQTNHFSFTVQGDMSRETGRGLVQDAARAFAPSTRGMSAALAPGM